MHNFVISFAISSLIMPVIIFMVRKLDITDKPEPGGRKHHKEPIPLLGGLGIYIAFALSIQISIDYSNYIQYLIIFSGIIAAIGIVDDIKDLKPMPKLAIEVVCAILVILLGVRFHIENYVNLDETLAFIISIVISVTWIVGITNSINLIDGLDGLAGGIAFIASTAFALLFMLQGQVVLSQMSFILMGAVLGFLIYNFYPAKIFMGDGGSLFLGFTLSIFSILYTNIGEINATVWVPIIILAIPLFETGSSIVRRIFRGSSVVKADNEHLHYRIVNKGLNQLAAVSILYAGAIMAGVLGVLIAIANIEILALFIIMSLIAIGLRLYI